MNGRLAAVCLLAGIALAADRDMLSRKRFQTLRASRQSGSELDDWLQAEKEIRRAQEEAIDEASEESFRQWLVAVLVDHPYFR